MLRRHLQKLVPSDKDKCYHLTEVTASLRIRKMDVRIHIKDHRTSSKAIRKIRKILL